MTKFTVIEELVPQTDEVIEHILINRGNGEFTSMPKAVWDELEAQREQSGTL